MKITKQTKAEQPSVLAYQAVDQFLGIEEVAALLGISKRQFERMLSAGTFTQRDLRFGRRRIWRSSAVQAWIVSETERQHGSDRRVA